MQTTIRLVLVVTFVWCVLSSWAGSQEPRHPPATGTKSIDQQAEKVQNDYLRGMVEVATKYEEAGDVAKAAEVLKAILKIKPDTESVKNKLKQFDEAVFDENTVTVELDAAAGWAPARVLLAKGKPVRLHAEGTYRFTASEMLGPAGFSAEDLLSDAVAGIPLGGLIAVVAPYSEEPNPNRQPNEKRVKPVPVYVGTDHELVPDEAGMLLFRLNVPESAKCAGKIKVKISGNFVALR